jgi:SAM-dependent methyltransferase
MHKTVENFLRRTDSKDIEGKYVVEFGSYNVNGGAREIIMPMKPALYEGYDMRAGNGVDKVTDFSQTCAFLLESGKPGVIICVNTLEHAKNWMQVVRNIKFLLQHNGLLIFSVPGPGCPYHDPPDYWRFTKKQVGGIFGDMKLEVLEDDPECNGSLFRGRSQVMTGTIPLNEYEASKVPGGDADQKGIDWEDI